jgi:2-polyprenyl-3-methyl-5-hydroxy-6-metoxy-1,4-benzoquinol methylase
MRYKVKGIEIRSENAAKPLSQRSAYLSYWIRSHPRVHAILDYGCGKLRYAPLLAQRARTLTLVDSEIQLGRVQMIGKELTTARDYARDHWPHSRILTSEEFSRRGGRYDLVLCVNVLSAIPIPKIRSRSLRLIASCLKPAGRCLFVTQYRNSYFRQIVQSRKATKHLNGWILKSRGGHSYYGIRSRLS